MLSTQKIGMFWGLFLSDKLTKKQVNDEILFYLNPNISTSPQQYFVITHVQYAMLQLQ